MTSHDNPACQWFERVWNHNDLAAIAALGTPDMKAHGADGVLRTPEMFADFQRVIRGALPDVHVDVRHCVGGRDMMAVHWFATGTHTGEAPGLPKPPRLLSYHVITGKVSQVVVPLVELS